MLLVLPPTIEAPCPAALVADAVDLAGELIPRFVSGHNRLLLAGRKEGEINVAGL